MIEAFLDLDTSAKLMLTSRNNIILFDTLEYDNQFLNKLYKILSEMAVDSVLVVTHAIYDKKPYNNVYHTETYQIGDSIYTGVLSQLDINKLMCVFNAVKISNIRFCDKMVMYDYFLKNGQCLVDSTSNTNIIVGKNDLGISSVTYVKTNSLEQSLLQICRKHAIYDTVNFNTFIDYDCVKWFENFVKVQELTVFVTLTVFGFFKFINTDSRVDINQVKFNSKLETVSYSTHTENTDKVLRGPAIQENSAKVSKAPIKEKSKKAAIPIKIKSKSHRSIPSALINLALILSIFSLILTFIADYYFTNKAKYPESLLNQNNSIINHVTLRLDKLEEAPVQNSSVIVIDLMSKCPVDVNIGSITISDNIEVVYYVAETGNIETVKGALSDFYKINGISESGIVTLNEIIYTKYTVSLSTK